MKPILTMSDIDKSFPGIQALEKVHLEVYPGEVHAIVGENGAGKSTLMKILAGLYLPDNGVIRIDDEPVTIPDQIESRRHGIAMVYQELNLVPDLSVAENIALGAMESSFGFHRKKATIRRAQEILRLFDAKIAAAVNVGTLSVSQQQLVEIAKAYAAEPRIMVLDEPTSSLSEHESQALFQVINTLRAEGIAVIYISHRLREVLSLADRVTVLRDGCLVEARPVEGLTSSKMIELMVGRELADVFPKREVEIGEVVLEAVGLTRTGVFEDINFTVRAGEIVGFAGLVGAGRTEVARAIFGLDKLDSGKVIINGTEVDTTSPKKAIAAGVAYVPEDRKRDGIIPALPIQHNITLGVLRRIQRLGWIPRRTERHIARERVEEMRVSPPTIDNRIDALSGGNQQKVVIGKWLAAEPSVLLLDEPTRGVDVGAKADLHELIGELAAQGTAVLMISSELPEVLSVSDRIYALCEGRITAEFSRSEANETAIMHAATGEVAV